MGTIIPLHGDPHQMTQELLPWYVAGTLDPADRRLVDAHLQECAACRAELESERTLSAAFLDLSDAAFPPQGAARPRDLVAARRRSGPRSWWPSTASGRLAAIAASQLLIVGAALAVYGGLSRPADGTYHVLSASAPGPAPGNVIVIFRPDMTEQALRTTLSGAHARIVDGPTAAGAYVLAVAPAQRGAVLAQLRAQSGVVLAQPIDAPAPEEGPLP